MKLNRRFCLHFGDLGFTDLGFKIANFYLSHQIQQGNRKKQTDKSESNGIDAYYAPH